MPKYPDRLRSSTAATFQRRKDLYAVRRDGPDDKALALVREDEKTTIAVYAGHPAASVDAVPVYSAGDAGPLAVPTGRVFVRLAEGIRPEQRRAAFAEAGFEIERTLPYAPSAAWLRPSQGGIARALSGLAALEKAPDVVHVEPQLLMERALKGR